MSKIMKRKASVDSIHWIADNGYCKLIWPDADKPAARKPVLVDTTTARALLAVRSALSPDAQDRFDDMIATDRFRFARCVDFAWRKVRLG